VLTGISTGLAFTAKFPNLVTNTTYDLVCAGLGVAVGWDAFANVCPKVGCGIAGVVGFL